MRKARGYRSPEPYAHLILSYPRSRGREGRGCRGRLGAMRDVPAGIEAHLVADQPAVVQHAVKGFMKVLGEAIIIVLAISFLSLGVRAGLVVALSIPLVLAITFVGMHLAGIGLQRVSLGATRAF